MTSFAPTSNIGRWRRRRRARASAVCIALVLTWCAGADAARLAAPLDGARNAIAETTLGDLVADAMRAASGADFALVQASVLQPVTLPAGAFGADQTQAILAAPTDTITILQLKAPAITAAIERSLAILPLPNKGLLQVAKLRVRYDPKRPSGARVLAITVAGTDEPLNPNQTYRVAVPESLAKGALGYFRVFNSAPRERTAVTLADAVNRYAAANGVLAPRIEERLQPAT